VARNIVVTEGIKTAAFPSADHSALNLLSVLCNKFADTIAQPHKFKFQQLSCGLFVSTATHLEHDKQLDDLFDLLFNIESMMNNVLT